MTTVPTRIDRELFETAAVVGAAHYRSAAQQLNYWARLGRQFELSSGVTVRDVERVMAGQLPYDQASEAVQAVVRAEWEDGMAADIAALDLAAEFRAAGETWVDADADGAPVVRS